MKALFTLLIWMLAVPASGCSVAIVFAIDISQSVSRSDYEFQRNGLARALLSPEVQALIGFNRGGIMATVMLWSGEAQQKQEIGWTALQSQRSIVDFAERITEMRRPYRYSLTAIGNALKAAGELHQSNKVRCQRRVIDISGDGVTSVIGQHPEGVVEPLVAQGVVINALIISGATPDPVQYYSTRVVRGAGSFLIVAARFEDFEAAMKRKLLRELAPALASLEADPPEAADPS